MVILKGKEIAEKNKLYCLNLINEYNLTPHLHIFLIGDDPASSYYVESIKKQSTKFNIKISVSNFSNNEIDENQLIKLIANLNKDDNIHGVMVQKPLPKNFDTHKIDQTINPEKDVDGIHPLNAGLLLLEQKCFAPCTAQAIIEIIDFYDIAVEGKHIVVVGRSNVVGKPVANLLLYKAKNRNATVTVCHSKTTDLSSFTKQADILILAVGQPKLVNGHMLKEGVVILDAGINKIVNENGNEEYVGDIDFDSCLSKSSAITPVRGGVGAVTTSILFKHLCEIAKNMKTL